MKWTIYCHTHVESGRRYIGLTKKTMLQRWNRHVYSSNRPGNGKWHFPNAIRKYGKDAFSHEVLEVCQDLDVANLAEECWIELLETRDPLKGFNLAKGGGHFDVVQQRNPWDRPEYRAKSTEASKRKWKDPSFRKAVTSGVVDSWKSPDHMSKMSEISKEVNARPEVRSAISSSLSGKPLKPSHRVKISTIVKGRLSSPEAKASHLAMVAEVHSRPEWVERQSASHRGKVTSDETKARISASNRSSDLEVRARISASSKAYWERRRSA